MAIIPFLMSVALGASMAPEPSSSGVVASSGSGDEQTLVAEPQETAAGDKETAGKEPGEKADGGKEVEQAGSEAKAGKEEAGETAEAFEVRRNAAERRYQTGLTPAHVKGLWCGLQLGGLVGDFEGTATSNDFMLFAGSVTSFQLGFVAGLSDQVGLDVAMRMAKTGAMFHNTTGIEAGVRVAPLGDGRRGIPMTLAARVGIAAIPGFMGPAWHEEMFSSESISEPAALGSLRLDFRAPIVFRSDRLWYLLGEAAMAYDIVQREVYHADLTVDVSKRPNVYSSEFLAGFGTGWSVPGKHLNVHVEVLGGALTWPDGLGQVGGATGVGLLRISLHGLSEDDLRRAGGHAPTSPAPPQ